MYLLDTNVCVDILAGNREMDEQLSRLERVRVYTSAVVVAELAYGALRSVSPERELTRVKQLMRDLPVVHFDTRATLYYGAIKADLASRGQLLEDNDLHIAATALARGLILVTHDKAFERIPELKIEDWRT